MRISTLPCKPIKDQQWILAVVNTHNNVTIIFTHTLEDQTYIFLTKKLIVLIFVIAVFDQRYCGQYAIIVSKYYSYTSTQYSILGALPKNALFNLNNYFSDIVFGFVLKKYIMGFRGKSIVVLLAFISYVDLSATARFLLVEVKETVTIVSNDDKYLRSIPYNKLTYDNEG